MVYICFSVTVTSEPERGYFDTEREREKERERNSYAGVLHLQSRMATSTNLLVLLALSGLHCMANAKAVKTVKGSATERREEGILYNREQFNMETFAAYMTESRKTVSSVEEMVKKVTVHNCDSSLVLTEIERKEFNALQELRTYTELLSKMELSIQSFLVYQYVNMDKCRDKNSTCTGWYAFTCLSGDCIHKNHVCNGIHDCADGSDEDQCSTPPDTCSEGEFKCGNSTRCINEDWKCDGDRDCLDGSDEKDCPGKICSDKEFMCQDNNRCIPSIWKCDGDRDCSDGSDEEVCPSGSCENNEVYCAIDDRCLSIIYLCDGRIDCNDESDEIGCGPIEVTTDKPDTHSLCKGNETECVHGSQCIRKNLWCDGAADCEDGSDEENCSPKECKQQETRCRDGSRCYLNFMECDGEKDCDDGSDEEDCDEQSCSPTQFRCVRNGGCIYANWRCDGQPDCDDGSDEKDCTYTTTTTPSSETTAKPDCPSEQFRCTFPSGQCIPPHWRCDGENDCNDGSDEEACSTTTTSTTSTTNQANCTSQQFQCKTSKVCVPISWLCDGERDCEDGSDEAIGDCFITNSLPPQPTIPTGSNQAVHTQPPSTTSWQPESTNPSPQRTATMKEPKCNLDQFTCVSDERCIPTIWLCDKEADCLDGSDEIDCPEPTTPKPAPCPRNNFHCGGDICIRKCFVCDGYEDCTDGRDEAGCTAVSTELTTPASDGLRSCLDNEIRCKSEDRCIYVKFQCDGRFDCADGSDEKHCHSTTIPPTTRTTGSSPWKGGSSGSFRGSSGANKGSGDTTEGSGDFIEGSGLYFYDDQEESIYDNHESRFRGVMAN